MNYISEMLQFYDYVQTHNLSSGQIALWHGLMHICNKTGWKHAFNATNAALEVVTGLSRSAILKNREVLKNLGLINFAPMGTKATIYTIHSLASAKADVEKEKELDVEEENNAEENVDNLQDNNMDTVDKVENIKNDIAESKQGKEQIISDMSKSTQESKQKSATYINQNNIYKHYDTRANDSLPVEKNNGYSKPRMVSSFVAPTLEEVEAYCNRNGYTHVIPGVWHSHYKSIGWMAGQNPIVDWEASVDCWERRSIASERTSELARPVQHGQNRIQNRTQSSKNKFHNFQQRDTDYDRLIREQQYPGYYQEAVAW